MIWNIRWDLRVLRELNLSYRFHRSLLGWSIIFLHFITEFCVVDIECNDPVYTRWRHQMETFSAVPGYWPFVRGIHRWSVNSPHKGQWRGALMFSLICAWINCWVNNREAGDLRRHLAHYHVIVMQTGCEWVIKFNSLSRTADIEVHVAM